MFQSAKIVTPLFLASLFFLIQPIHSSPTISCKNPKVSLKAMKKGEMSDFVSHTFVIKNTGTSDLKIKECRLDCKCSKVEYDSLIPPGKEGKISIKIESEELKGGKFTKSIKVLSNASNKKVLDLAVSGYVIDYIIVETSFLSLTPEKDSSVSGSIVLKTDYSKFDITSIQFKPSIDDPKYNPFSIKHQLKKETNTDKNGLIECTITLAFKQTFGKTIGGKFILTTNHPKMKTATVRGLAKQIR